MYVCAILLLWRRYDWVSKFINIYLYERFLLKCSNKVNHIVFYMSNYYYSCYYYFACHFQCLSQELIKDIFIRHSWNNNARFIIISRYSPFRQRCVPCRVECCWLKLWVDPRCFLVGSNYNDNCGLRWYEVTPFKSNRVLLVKSTADTNTRKGC